MKLISCNLDNYICVDTSVKKCTDVLIKGAAIPGKSAMMLNFTIHYNFNIENHGIVHVETIIFFQAIFINKPIATPSVNFTLTLYWRIAISNYCEMSVVTSDWIPSNTFTPMEWNKSTSSLEFWLRRESLYEAVTQDDDRLAKYTEIYFLCFRAGEKDMRYCKIW